MFFTNAPILFMAFVLSLFIFWTYFLSFLTLNQWNSSLYPHLTSWQTDVNATEVWNSNLYRLQIITNPENKIKMYQMNQTEGGVAGISPWTRSKWKHATMISQQW